MKSRSRPFDQAKSTLNYLLIVAVLVLLIVGLLLYRNFRHRQQLAKQREELQQQHIQQLEKDKQLICSGCHAEGTGR
jgi:signal transduction histidine kinase